MPFTRRLTILAQLVGNTYAAPAPMNITSSPQQYVAWQSQPNERGTWDILTTCVLTMSLCIWTALHLNIPMDSSDQAEIKTLRGRIYRSKAGRQAGWIVMGLFAPELVVYTAWQQRRVVKAISAMAQTAQKRARLSGEAPTFKWTESHSWYLVMGGFYFDTNTKEPYVPGSPNLILTSEAMHLLTSTSPPLLPCVEEDTIKDRSKADKITKCLAALQAIYQFAQCATRWRGGLPVSQLEVNTFGHILCALAIYYCWFRKLKDVEIRTRIDTSWADPLAAYLSMCMRERPRAASEHPDIMELFPVLRRMRDPDGGVLSDTDEEIHSGDEKTLVESDDDHAVPKPVAKPTRMIIKYRAPHLEKTNPSTKAIPPLTSTASFPNAREFSCPLDAASRLNPMVDNTTFKSIISPILKSGFRPAELQSHSQIPQALTCVNLALQYLSFWSTHVVTSTTEGPDGPTQIATGMLNRKDWTMPPYAEHALTTRNVNNWPELDRSRTWHFGLVLPAAMIAALTVGYGGIHASAWKYHFPTRIEAVLWQVASVVIASSGVMVMLDRLVLAASSYLTDRIVCADSDAGGPWVEYGKREAAWLPGWLRVMIRPFVSWRRGVLGYLGELAGQEDGDGKYSALVKGPVIMCLGLFVVARMFVVVEAFVSLRSLPVMAYETPSWSGWIVHL